MVVLDEMKKGVDKDALFRQLPSPWCEDLRSVNLGRVESSSSDHKVVVLDDDPTGTQTVYDVPVLTEWSVESLRREFATEGPCFYILTNSRSLDNESARALNREIARNLLDAVGDRNRFSVVSRSDSTLRGHFPAETDILNAELGPFDATLLIPYFDAGGRYTIHDIHYVMEQDRLVPASETPFALDAAFGYGTSNLREWVEEKTRGTFSASEVASLSLGQLREDGPEAVADTLAALAPGTVVVVNAAAPSDLDVLVSALFSPTCREKRYLFRTGAEFVRARLGLAPRFSPVVAETPTGERTGGLIVVGSYVPKSSQQLESLREQNTLTEIELSIESVLDEHAREATLAEATERLNRSLAAGEDVVLFTERDLVRGDTPEASLEIGRQVSDALVRLVGSLSARPRFLIAKGGITSSDLASKALGVRRAMVMGQALAGVPVWRLGDETAFPGLAYVVFPGNVGDATALSEVYQRFRNQEEDPI